MLKKAIIIIPNEQINNLSLYVAEGEKNHLEELIKFLYRSGVDYPVTSKTTSQEIAFYLGELGYTVMLYDYSEHTKDKNLVVFLPKQISKNQFNWFEKRKQGLLEYNLMIFEIVDNTRWNPIDETTTKEPIISELDKIMNKKLIRKP